ncbi:MAG: hypothetical protein IIX54_05960 [Clostridia bacterium]|nr:hypothetical protein [Clostridia bacterium]
MDGLINVDDYIGVYANDEIELNNKLYDECCKEPINFAAVEELLKAGADPLGGTEANGWHLLDHIYGELVCGSQDNNSIDLPKITELFLKYGMNVDKPRIPYDDANSINPAWDFGFVTNENAIIALKMLLDCGLSADSFGLFWDHVLTDFFHIECGDPQNDAFWNYECVWSLKMMLLGASYDHILKNDKWLQKFLCCDYNTFDIKKFRNWDNFDYYFDTSHCVKHPDFYKSIVHIYEKETGKEVWIIGVGNSGRKLLGLN